MPPPAPEATPRLDGTLHPKLQAQTNGARNVMDRAALCFSMPRDANGCSGTERELEHRHSL